MTIRPRVSVVIPTFQGQARIGQALRRLERQTFSDFEVIVVNDGSTDDTSTTVRRAIQADPRIRLVEQSNQGIAAARNRGLEAARGDVFAFLDDDDLWLPQKLELQLARLDAVPQAAVVSCLSAMVDDEGRLLGWRLGGETEGDVYREMLEWDMISGGSVALVARRPLEEIGGFDASVSHRADWDLWIRLARRYPFTHVPRTLVGYTRRDGSASRSYERMLEDGREVLAKARRNDPSIADDEFRALLARDLFGAACFSLADDQRSHAWRYLARSLRGAPSIILTRPRRLGIIGMLTLSTVLPNHVYRYVVAAVSRGAFRLELGAAFDSLM
jgi:glycosyltransferase involved in cell wall biosynthesis